MLLQILQGFALRHVIRIFLKVTKPELAILPVNIPQSFHGIKLQLGSNLGNYIMLAEPLAVYPPCWPPTSARI
jgi:hypothetical protein